MATATKNKPAKKTAKSSTIAPRPKRKPAQAPPAAPKAQKRKPAPEPEPEVSDRSSIISAAMLELSEERKEARAKRDGKPAKHLVFDAWFKSISTGKALDLAPIVKKYQDVKETTIKSWVNTWHNLKNLPSNAPAEKIIAAALKKLK